MKSALRPQQMSLVLALGLACTAMAPWVEPATGQEVSASASETGAAAGLVGSWTLDRSLSQVPTPPAGGRHRGGASGGPGEGMGGPPPGGMEGGPPPDEMGGRRGDRGEPPARPEGLGGSRALKIELAGLDVRMTSASGRVRVITPGGEAVERARGPMLVTETARWEGERLVIESVAEDGPMTTESFALAEDGSDRLIHTVLMLRPDTNEQVKAVWVYDRTTPTD